MEAKTFHITTKKGTYKAIRVDDDFLCQCGCRKRIKSNMKFFSEDCYAKYLRENNIMRNTSESVKKSQATSKRLTRLLEE